MTTLAQECTPGMVLDQVKSWQAEHGFWIQKSDHLVVLYQTNPQLLIKLSKYGVPFGAPGNLGKLAECARHLYMLANHKQYSPSQHIEGKNNRCLVTFENFRLPFESTPAEEVRLMLEGLKKSHP